MDVVNCFHCRLLANLNNKKSVKKENAILLTTISPGNYPPIVRFTSLYLHCGSLLPFFFFFFVYVFIANIYAKNGTF